MKYIQISIVILFLNLVCLPPVLRAATDMGTQDAGVMQLETKVANQLESARHHGKNSSKNRSRKYPTVRV